jgi:hypothetical protein
MTAQECAAVVLEVAESNAIADMVLCIAMLCLGWTARMIGESAR